MKIKTLLLLSFILIACDKKYDLKSVLEEYDNPNSDYAFIFTSVTIDDEIGSYNELLNNYEKGDTLISMIGSHIKRLNGWKYMYLDSMACLAFAAWKPDPCPCPPIVECLYRSSILSIWTRENHNPFKCSVNGKAIKIAGDVYMKKYHLRFFELAPDLDMKPGDEINMVIPISYYSNNKLVSDSLVINTNY